MIGAWVVPGGSDPSAHLHAREMAECDVCRTPFRGPMPKPYWVARTAGDRDRHAPWKAVPYFIDSTARFADGPAAGGLTHRPTRETNQPARLFPCSRARAVDLALMWRGPAARRCVWMTPPLPLRRVIVAVALVAGVTSMMVAVER